MGQAADHELTADASAETDDEIIRDRGISLVEILVSIVLLGTAITAMLTTLRVTIDASALDRDHANAHAWLQTAADVLYGEPREDCGSQSASLQSDVHARYNQIVKDTFMSNPEGWSANHIQVVYPVLFWDGEQYQLTCYDDQGINLQLITIQVTNEDNRIIETVQVVKGG